MALFVKQTLKDLHVPANSRRRLDIKAGQIEKLLLRTWLW